MTLAGHATQPKQIFHKLNSCNWLRNGRGYVVRLRE